MVLLADQDRSRWDAAHIARGLDHLDRARSLGPPGPYRLQAQIAACHAAAPSWEQTDWRAIVRLYDRLAEVSPSPVVELNRAAAVSMLEGPATALVLLDRLAAAPALRDYHLLPAARADLLRRLRRWGQAGDEYRRARELTKNQRERAFLEKRIAECDAALATEAS